MIATGKGGKEEQKLFLSSDARDLAYKHPCLKADIADDEAESPTLNFTNLLLTRTKECPRMKR